MEKIEVGHSFLANSESRGVDRGQCRYLDNWQSFTEPAHPDYKACPLPLQR
jgi:hypothetical protein